MQPAVQLQKRGMRLQGIAVEIKEKAWILPPGSALRLSNVDIFKADKTSVSKFSGASNL